MTRKENLTGDISADRVSVYQVKTVPLKRDHHLGRAQSSRNRAEIIFSRGDGIEWGQEYVFRGDKTRLDGNGK